MRQASCKPGHLCPEIYKALDGILFIAETKKQQEEKMRVREGFKNSSSANQETGPLSFTPPTH